MQKLLETSICKISIMQLRLPPRDVLLVPWLGPVTDQSAKILSSHTMGSFAEYTQKRSLASAYRWACDYARSESRVASRRGTRTVAMRLVCAHLITIGMNGRADERTSMDASPLPRGGQSKGLFPRRLRVHNCHGVHVYEARARHHTGAIGNEETIKIISITIH